MHVFYAYHTSHDIIAILTRQFIITEPLSAPMESLRPTRSLSWRGSGPSVGRTSKGFSFLDTETCQVIAGIAHRLIQNPGGIKRVCAHCKRLGSKFACGMFRRSYYRCDACNVSLCRPNFKDCFYQWHHQLAKLTLEKWKEISDHQNIQLVTCALFECLFEISLWTKVERTAQHLIVLYFSHLLC